MAIFFQTMVTYDYVLIGFTGIVFTQYFNHYHDQDKIKGTCRSCVHVVLAFLLTV